MGSAANVRRMYCKVNGRWRGVVMGSAGIKRVYVIRDFLI